MRAKWYLGSDSKDMFKGHRKLSHVQDTLKATVFQGKSKGPRRSIQCTDMTSGLDITKSPGNR